MELRIEQVTTNRYDIIAVDARGQRRWLFSGTKSECDIYMVALKNAE